MDEDIDRIALKQQRKERKQIKKQVKREEQQKEHEKKYLQLKYGSKDSRVQIISNISNKPCSTVNHRREHEHFNIENLDNSFPTLEQTCHLKNKIATTTKNDLCPQENITQTPQTNHNNKSSATLILNINDILTVPSSKNAKQTREKPKNPILYGNILDASQPIRLRGKRREIPKRKQPSKLKTQIISDSKLKVNDVARNGIHSSNFETYCDHIVTDDLNILVKKFLSDIVRFQENMYKRDPIKGNAKRRYIVGLREVKKFVVIKKIKLIIIAPNIRTIVENGALDTAVHDLISLAKENEIPYIFALSRWKLGEFTLKFRPISCIGIFDYSGTEENYHEILNITSNARITYMNLISTKTNEDILTENDETQEIVQKLVNICTS